ncbi:cysteine synthase /cystathionine gamma-synthase [Streptohalobacillus salinus]|uniref:Cysteine synthase /cystathionine gamma-synthase n=1 Tax=Streptohalobacillus salinus TaxID=621096 RepID=A0A2V3WV31_9BACI|nr:PLP-dependent transferase [Streptohalobacillus salinus]PXW92962.1 cysteine synthase /cystathionine gamma-synthase [Streptohalobacillus salinus]
MPLFKMSNVVRRCKIIYQLETQFTQIGNRSETETGAVSTPIHLSTAYRHETLGVSTGYDYTRTKNPTRSLVEAAIADLEGGVRGFATASGMSAIQLVLSLLRSGDHLICSRDVYGGTYRLFADYTERYGIEVSYLDLTDPSRLKQAIQPNTAAIFVETPTNPLLEVTPIAVISELAKTHDVQLIVDNTFMTPFLQQPLVLGADVVVHSASKFLAGHNDCLAGLVVAKDEPTADLLTAALNNGGSVLSAFDSWLLIRGMKTLPLRMKAQVENAQALVTCLKRHPSITTVRYPNQGAMISFSVRDEVLVAPFLQQLRLISFAESLGGVESFITYPTTQTHADIPEQMRSERGITRKLLRFSVGIEASVDLIADITQALERAEQIVSPNNT